MKTSAWIMRPVRPSYMTSRPDFWKPASTNDWRRASSRSPLKAVPSTCLPSREPTLPPIISSTWATVIREGMAWGLMTRSGMMPSAVKGMSEDGTSNPTTPFCPCLEANLSPSSGILSSRTLTLTKREPFSDSVSMTLSTQPVSPARTVTEVSRLLWPDRKLASSSSTKRGGEVLPTRTCPPETGVSGDISPSSSERLL
ncbi:MAG: hypothetical protein A4E30_00093 [Methanomassiliicoccales archaeon PtaB.Bin215]|nr:MAG: hypothetical protein A4E30_00093 [Methanomassiliicoccales archaeon PtaB.Bin215]